MHEQVRLIAARLDAYQEDLGIGQPAKDRLRISGILRALAASPAPRSIPLPSLTSSAISLARRNADTRTIIKNRHHGIYEPGSDVAPSFTARSNRTHFSDASIDDVSIADAKLGERKPVSRRTRPPSGRCANPDTRRAENELLAGIDVTAGHEKVMLKLIELVAVAKRQKSCSTKVASRASVE